VRLPGSPPAGDDRAVRSGSPRASRRSPRRGALRRSGRR
jgi:hypothetical protein